MLLSRFLGEMSVCKLLAIICSVLSDDEEIQLPPDLQMFWPSSSFRERELRVTCAACSAGNIEESRLVERAVVSGGKAKFIFIFTMFSLKFWSIIRIELLIASLALAIYVMPA
ncbi:hypothetical protein OESDEN_10945 [Oesophagostomum dentatum]|uniref:Uncharacterized protein n=1 Tax=Oesophagostomum dentatum TaxID=61180 RepID=A0A0B1SZB3_OESDE|nr:hypothetical protein OESDEN_10945 [Oesophagostomum dentatum]